MYPLHDNDLDRLSREAAEHFEVESGASGWANLEKRLDQELPQKKKRRRFLFWLFLITATTGGALTGILSYHPLSPLAKNAPGVVSPAGNTTPLQSNNPGSSTQANDKAATNSVAGNNTPSGSNEAGAEQSTTTGPNTISDKQLPAASVNNPKPGAGNNQPAAPAAVLATTPDKNIPQTGVKAGISKRTLTHTQQTTDKTPLTLNYATIVGGNNRPKGNAGRPIKSLKQQPAKRQQTIAGQHIQSVTPVPDNVTAPGTNNNITNDQNNNTEPVDNNTNVTSNNPVAATPADSAKTNKTGAKPASDSTQTLAQQKKEDRKKDKVKQLEIGLMTGPDLSTVDFGPLYKTGYNFGLQIGYRFSNRWSVNAGVIYTKKFYKADSSHFEYKNQWNRKPDNMEGNCSMWELPVNVRYDVSFNDKRRWFVSTGLSTYLMDKENYDLNYSWATAPYNYFSDTNKNYLFSILNLSAGMERSLGKRFSIQAEPYLKVPLKDLGTAKIRMDSYGVLFTLKYKPGFRAKKTGKQ